MQELLPAAVIALTLLTPSAHAAKSMIVCRDANGNAFFTDVSCPAEAIREGTRHATQAQTYNGRESINTDLLNSYERRNGSGTTWQWNTKPAPDGAGR